MTQDIEAAKDAARKLLASKRRSSIELQRFLEVKGYDSETIKEIALWAEQYHFVDDAEYARSYVAQNAGRCSKNQIYYVLQERGISETFISTALEEVRIDEREVLRQLFKAALKGDHSKKNILKAARNLARKGFEYEDIQSYIDEFVGFDSDERMTEFEL